MAVVKVYSTPTCPYCSTLKKFLKDNNIEFENIDLSKDQKALEEIIQKTGKLEVPVVDIDGQIVDGFDKKEICQLLKIKE